MVSVDEGIVEGLKKTRAEVILAVTDNLTCNNGLLGAPFQSDHFERWFRM